MADSTAPSVADEILQRDILPTIFPGPPSATPVVVLVAGQPGAGRGRVAARIAATEGATALSGDELRAFHPITQSEHLLSGEQQQEVATATAGWLRDCLRYARTDGHSVVLEGAFTDAAVVRGTAAQFAAAGFGTRVAVVGARRADSLLAVLSHYLRNVQASNPATYTSRSAHDAGFGGTRALVAAIEADPAADRLTVVDGRGDIVFDAARHDAGAFAGASAALAVAQGGRMSRLESTQWLSELHHVTAFAQSQRRLPRDVAETLVELHEIALSEVIPQLHVPAGARFAEMTARTTSARLAALRESLVGPVQPDAAAPVVVPAGPERGGISR